MAIIMLPSLEPYVFFNMRNSARARKRGGGEGKIPVPPPPFCARARNCAYGKIRRGLIIVANYFYFFIFFYFFNMYIKIKQNKTKQHKTKQSIQQSQLYASMEVGVKREHDAAGIYEQALFIIRMRTAN